MKFNVSFVLLISLNILPRSTPTQLRDTPTCTNLLSYSYFYVTVTQSKVKYVKVNPEVEYFEESKLFGQSSEATLAYTAN